MRRIGLATPAIPSRTRIPLLLAVNVRRVLLPALLVLPLAACTNTAAAPDSLVPAICDAIATDDVTEATEVFWSRAHAPLHDLADDLQAQDRALTARMLEAKYDVETVAPRDGDPGPTPLVDERLEALLTRVREGLRALDRPAPSC